MISTVSRAASIRACVCGAIVVAGLCGVAYRAWGLQVDDGDRYRVLADRQHAMRVEVPAPRGEIVDARGRSLAASADVDSVWANPHEIQDVTATAERLAKILGGEPRELEARLAGDRRFQWLARHVTPEIAKAVRDAKLAGVEVAREPRRWYPARTIAGPVVGRSDIDGRGLDGLELAMNDLLTGRRGAATAVRDARGHAMLADGLSGSDPGATVELSLDRSIEAIADDALAAQVNATKAKSGVAVVLDVATSRVLAMASYPTFDPNAPNIAPAGAAGAVVPRNRAVTDAYEAGSVMKVFSVATALEDGVVSPDTEFELGQGVFYVGPAPIHDVHVDPYLTVAGIIKRSSNIGAAKIALRLGRDKLYAGLKKFGFGGRTGIELPGEQSGMLRDGSKWRDVELATIAYGYGLTVTPLQVATGFAAIAHGGLWTEPRIVDRVVDPVSGETLYAPKPEQRQVVSERTASEMMKMLGSVFDRDLKHGGTGREIVVPGFVCGGKTGTAHKYDPETHKYSTDRYLSSFAGVAPLDHPRIAVVVMIDEPSGGDYYGGKVAGPVFATIASSTLRYLGVPGSAIVDPSIVLAPTPQAKAAAEAAVAAKAKPATPPAASKLALPVSQPPSAFADDQVPDFRGLGVTKALELARARHLGVELSGSGRVVEQSPAPGAAAGRVMLRFSDGG